MIRISVVMPTFNRIRIIERTLAALAEQDFPPSDYEIVVVVDGSTDGTAELLRTWRPGFAFRVVEAPHRGVSAARNLGIRAAAGNLVLLLDDDLLAAPNLLCQHWEAHAGADACIVHGPIYLAPGSAKTLFGNNLGRFYEGHYRHLSAAMDLRFPNGIPSYLTVFSQLRNASAPRDLLLRSDGFDEQLQAAEDLEFGLRLWKMGASFRYNPSATAHEFYVKSSWDYLRGQAKALGAGDLVASRKHPEYRPYSRLAHFAETSLPKKWTRAALMKFPLSPIPLLALPLRLERWFCRWPLVERAGLRLFSFLETIASWRGGMRAAGSWTRLKSEFDRRLPAFTYYRVGPPRSGVTGETYTSPQRFEQDIRRLVQRGYMGIAPSDWLRWLREGKDLPEKPVLVTFEENHADIAEYALPVLRGYGFKAVVFVSTGTLAESNTRGRAQVLDNLSLMTPEQIRYWSGLGIEFGSRGRTAADLTRLSADECLEEIVGSKNDLAAILGSRVTAFAYPNGKYNGAVCELVKSEFDLAFTAKAGVNYLRSNPHLLARADSSQNEVGWTIRKY